MGVDDSYCALWGEASAERLCRIGWSTEVRYLGHPFAMCEQQYLFLCIDAPKFQLGIDSDGSVAGQVLLAVGIRIR